RRRPRSRPTCRNGSRPPTDDGSSVDIRGGRSRQPSDVAWRRRPGSPMAEARVLKRRCSSERAGSNPAPGTAPPPLAQVGSRHGRYRRRRAAAAHSGHDRQPRRPAALAVDGRLPADPRDPAAALVRRLDDRGGPARARPVDRHARPGPPARWPARLLRRVRALQRPPLRLHEPGRQPVPRLPRGRVELSGRRRAARAAGRAGPVGHRLPAAPRAAAAAACRGAGGRGWWRWWCRGLGRLERRRERSGRVDHCRRPRVVRDPRARAHAERLRGAADVCAGLCGAGLRLPVPAHRPLPRQSPDGRRAATRAGAAPDRADALRRPAPQPAHRRLPLAPRAAAHRVDHALGDRRRNRRDRHLVRRADHGPRAPRRARPHRVQPALQRPDERLSAPAHRALPVQRPGPGRSRARAGARTRTADARGAAHRAGGRLIRAAAAALVLAALTAAGIVAAAHLWQTTVPGDLRLPHLQASREFPARDLHRAESFEAFVRVTFLLSQAALVAVLAVYARRGTAFMRESAAGPIGTGFLLGMLGLALVWLARLPFGLVDLWWARRHDVVHVGYVEWFVDDFFGLGGKFLYLCLALLIVMGLARLVRQAWWIPAAAAFVGLLTLFTFTGPYLVPDLHAPKARELRAEAARLARREGVAGVPLRIEDVHDWT